MSIALEPPQEGEPLPVPGTGITERESAPLAVNGTQQPSLPGSAGDLTTMQVAQALAKSGYFPTVQSVAQAIVKMLAGRELGVPPVAAMQGIYIVQGRVAMSANMIAGLVKKSGKYTYQVRLLNDKECVIEFFERHGSGWGTAGTSQFTLQDAQRAGLLRPGAPGKLNAWQAYPRNMLFARAMSNGARWYCPDIFNAGIVTPEEVSPGTDAVPSSETAEQRGDTYEPAQES